MNISALHTSKQFRLALAMLSLSVMAAMSCARAQSGAGYPVKPVTIVLPFAAGGPNDVENRLYSPLLQSALGQTVLIDYKPGAGASIGTLHVARAAPDGYTLLAVSTSFTVVPAFQASGPYDPVKDFAHVSLIARRGAMLMVHPSLGVKNFAEYVAYAKGNPGAINFGTSGQGSIFHIVGAWMHSGTGTRATFIHYKGAAPMYTDLVAGRIHAAAALFFTGMPFVKAGKALAIANLGQERSKYLPDQRTIAEQGIAGFDYSSWSGYLFPAATPAAIVNRMSAALATVARSPDLVRKMEAEGAEMVGSSPEEFRRLVASEASRWRRVVQENGITSE